MSKSRGQNSSMSINGQNVIGAINASGSARVDVDQMIIHQTAPEMEKLFKRAHEQIKVRPEDPKVDQAKLENQVKKFEAEAAKSEAADQSKLERWLDPWPVLPSFSRKSSSAQRQPLPRHSEFHGPICI